MGTFRHLDRAVFPIPGGERYFRIDSPEAAP
jgi:hypothetical protein